MDPRDAAFWYRESVARLAQQELDIINATSCGMGGGEDAKKHIRSLQSAIRNAHRSPEKVQAAREKRTLESLEKLGRGNRR